MRRRHREGEREREREDGCGIDDDDAWLHQIRGRDAPRASNGRVFRGLGHGDVVDDAAAVDAAELLRCAAGGCNGRICALDRRAAAVVFRVVVVVRFFGLATPRWPREILLVECRRREE